MVRGARGRGKGTRQRRRWKTFEGWGVFSPGWRPEGSWSGKARWHTAQIGTRRWRGPLRTEPRVTSQTGSEMWPTAERGEVNIIQRERKKDWEKGRAGGRGRDWVRLAKTESLRACKVNNSLTGSVFHADCSSIKRCVRRAAADVLWLFSNLTLNLRRNMDLECDATWMLSALLRCKYRGWPKTQTNGAALICTAY